ncbi:hypothetical protein MSPP1_002770 [Malassezia sp. CBS 17886]|nr:hypothetical protein MSPP1_002770 [Malassezia sp. CBS 17886]
MSRFVKFALFIVCALTVFATVVRAESYYDDDGQEIQFVDSKLVDDDDFEDDASSKRPLQVRGKNAFGMAKRTDAVKLAHTFTHGPDHLEEMVHGGVKVTWYASQDLKNPACGSGGWDPINKSHIGAVGTGWSKAPKCGDFVRLCNPKNTNCVKVRIIDECAGCRDNHVDVTKSAFKTLATTGTLDEGVTAGLQMWTSRHPNPWDVSLYGPYKLQI